MKEMLESVITIAELAGKEILSVYDGSEPMDITTKADQSPVTRADKLADALILDRLQALDDSIPVLSEELELPPYSVRSSWSRYWLIDPMDGTRHFLDRDGEFTVNIALIESGVPTLGIVHVPVSGESYYGGTAVGGAWKRDARGTHALGVAGDLRQGELLTIVVRRSNKGEAMERLIDSLRARFKKVEMVIKGSSLKLCMLADAEADFYPRLSPTCEWDTAAAHAVLLAAGGEIFDEQFVPLRYNQKESMLNPNFFAVGDSRFDWQQLIQQAMS